MRDAPCATVHCNRDRQLKSTCMSMMALLNACVCQAYVLSLDSGSMHGLHTASGVAHSSATCANQISRLVQRSTAAKH